MLENVIDACCLINLSAAGELKSWLRVLGGTWHLPKAVHSESLYLRIEQPDGIAAREIISLQPAIEARRLQLCEPVGAEEMELYLELAVSLDDGEAMALALAKARGWKLATDDRKAILLAEKLHVEIITTPELVKSWAERTKPTAAVLREVLLHIQTRARFFPNDKSPLRDWWFDITASP